VSYIPCIYMHYILVLNQKRNFRKVCASCSRVPLRCTHLYTCSSCKVGQLIPVLNPDMFIQRKNRVSKGLKNCTNISTFKLGESFFFVSVYIVIDDQGKFFCDIFLPRQICPNACAMSDFCNYNVYFTLGMIISCLL
jgi:hypothetical protein